MFNFVTVYLNYFHLLLDVEHLSQTDSYENLKECYLPHESLLSTIDFINCSPTIPF